MVTSFIFDMFVSSAPPHPLLSRSRHVKHAAVTQILSRSVLLRTHLQHLDMLYTVSVSPALTLPHDFWRHVYLLFSL